jgi:hypothetical protein
MVVLLGACGSSGNNGGADAGSDGQSGPPIQACVDAPSGQWQEITPPDLHRDWWCTPDFNPNGCGGPGDTGPNKIATYGAHFVAAAPSAPGTIYLGTSSLGFWKSSDCGATWTEPDGGNTDVDAGRNWTIAVDPNDANTVYTTAGYGANGVYKSTDGGATWKQMLSSNIQAVASFVEKITLQPGDAKHVLVSFHDTCLTSATTADMFPQGVKLSGNLPAGAVTGKTSAGDPGWGCLAESNDGGESWTLTTNAITWEGYDGPGQAMVDAKTWFYASNSGTGVFFTTTGGVSSDGASPAWEQVIVGQAPGSVYVSPDKTFYTSHGNTVVRSTNGTDWTDISDASVSIGLSSFNGSTPFVQGGSKLYASVFSYSPPIRYFVSDVDPTNFAALPADTSGMTNGGGALDYDTHYDVLYSSNMVGGLWRYKP